MTKSTTPPKAAPAPVALRSGSLEDGTRFKAGKPIAGLDAKQRAELAAAGVIEKD